MSETTEVTRGEQVEAWQWWKHHREALEREGAASQEDLRVLIMWTGSPDQFGCGPGQIRPGELGKWDFLNEAQLSGVVRLDAILLSGLSIEEVQREEQRDQMSSGGYDPDNPLEVEEYHRRLDMSPAELDAEIARLQALLSTAS